MYNSITYNCTIYTDAHNISLYLLLILLFFVVTIQLFSLLFQYQ